MMTIATLSKSLQYFKFAGYIWRYKTKYCAH
jgi:hypothetical protein